MKHSDSITEIAKALLAAQKAIKAALKDSTNPHFKSRYADLSSVIDAVKGPLNAAGIVFTQGVSGTDNSVTVETMLIHTSGEWMSETLPVPVTRLDAQGVGSAITYGRRYGLQSMCGVPAEDDDGNAATASAPVQGSIHKPTDGARERLTTEQHRRVLDVANRMRDWLNAESVGDAVCELENANFDVDQKTYCWSLFDSKQRSAMKREHERQKKAAQDANDVAMQA